MTPDIETGVHEILATSPKYHSIQAPNTVASVFADWSLGRVADRNGLLPFRPQEHPKYNQ